MIAKCAIQMPKEVYFMDYTKVFEKLHHKELLELIDKFDLYLLYIRKIQDLAHQKQIICIWIENNFRKETKKKTDIKQGYIFSHVQLKNRF